MKIICWNVNGLRSIYSKGFLELLKNESPDLVCLQETKVWPEQLTNEQINPTGYHGLLVAADKKGYSGVATFIKTGLTCNNHVTSIGYPDFDKEGRFLITKFADFTLYNIYFPSGTTGDIRQAYKYAFLDAFLTHLKTLSTAELHKVIICGDFNICHKDIDIHHPEQARKLELSGFLPREKAWLDELEQFGFIDSFRHIHGSHLSKYTWWTFRAGARAKNLGWRIDYFWVNSQLQNKIKNAEILSTVTGSDHVPIILELEL